MTSYHSDILAKGLNVIFCGINPAASAVVAGHNFSHPSNRFWKVLHLSGFTNDLLAAENERLLLKHRCGITAVVTKPTRRSSEITVHEFKRAIPFFEAKIHRCAPRFIAFLGKQAIEAMLAQRVADWGPQKVQFAGIPTWVLPNPSGLNRSFRLNALVGHYEKLRVAVELLPSSSHKHLIDK